MTIRLHRGLASLGVLGLGAGGLLAVAGVAAPATAFTGTCSTTTPAATLVANGVCEVRFTTPGDATFTVPAGITKLSAVLVGGGGGAGHTTEGDPAANVEYAGGGGDVQFIDSVTPVPATLAIHVGAGGGGFADGSGNPGDATTVGSATAQPGNGGTNSGGTQGYSGSNMASGLCHADANLSLGGGAKTAATDTQADCAPGAGLALSDLSGLTASPLWPAGSFATTAYGAGGSVDSGPAGTANPGDGGSVVDEVGQDGSNGLVILRFAAEPPKPELAATGVAVDGAVPGLAALALAAGAVLLGLARRRSRRA